MPKIVSGMIAQLYSGVSVNICRFSANPSYH
jgi:hypothetical protein